MKHILFISLLFCLQAVTAQKSRIDWIGFEQLDDSLKIENKPVLIYFYTDWCVYCKKMERHAFKDPEIISKISRDFYAVKMNAESTAPIEFEGQTFINQQAETRRNGVHQIPLILAARENQKVSFPTLLVLDKNFRIRKRSFEYLTAERLKELIKS